MSAAAPLSPQRKAPSEEEPKPMVSAAVSRKNLLELEPEEEPVTPLVKAKLLLAVDNLLTGAGSVATAKSEPKTRGWFVGKQSAVPKWAREPHTHPEPHSMSEVAAVPQRRPKDDEPHPVSEVAAVPRRRPKDDEPHPVSEVAAVPQRRPKDDEPHPVSEVAAVPRHRRPKDDEPHPV